MVKGHRADFSAGRNHFATLKMYKLSHSIRAHFPFSCFTQCEMSAHFSFYFARYAFPRARSQSSLAALSFNLNPCACRRYPRWVVLREDSRYPQTKIKRGKKDSVSVGERANISSPTVPLFSTFLNDARGYNDLNKHSDAGTHWNSCFFIIIIFCTYLYRGYSVEFSCRSTNCTCIIIAWFSTILLVSISSWTSSARKRQCLDTRWQLRSVALSKRPETHSTTPLTAPAGSSQNLHCRSRHSCG